ncbi:MAG: MFS transporter [Pseudomonadales bacterium]
MKPLQYYFAGAASWFLAYGIQSVIFSWLVTIVLEQPAAKVGFAQMAFLLPAMIFMLLGGSLADQWGGHRVAVMGHLLAASAPLFLTIVILLGHMDYSMIIVFAVVMGIAQAFVTPARDGLLAQVAEGQIQRRVVQASMIQFSLQMVGFGAAAMADLLGAVLILSFQCALMLLGAFFFYRMQLPAVQTEPGPATGMVRQVVSSISEGFQTVRSNGYMSTVVLQNCAMGIFFMGSYIVTIPILIRETYAGSSVELSFINAANSLGLVLTIMALLRFGEIHRQGRALLISQAIGSIVLASASFKAGFSLLTASIFVWGLCGGIAMTMSRTIMQELAPETQRARMMAFYSFSFMGAGPIGAVVSGYLVEWFGASQALLISSTAMFMVVMTVALRSPLWLLDTSPEKLAAARSGVQSGN